MEVSDTFLRSLLPLPREHSASPTMNPAPPIRLSSEPSVPGSPSGAFARIDEISG
jgi:hypothetical protein